MKFNPFTLSLTEVLDKRALDEERARSAKRAQCPHERIKRTYSIWGTLHEEECLDCGWYVNSD